MFYKKTYVSLINIAVYREYIYVIVQYYKQILCTEKASD